jgi:hypothetical protein
MAETRLISPRIGRPDRLVTLNWASLSSYGRDEGLTGIGSAREADSASRSTPYVVNERAVGGWQKAGFRAVEEREPNDDHHLDRWLLMEFDPALAAVPTE